MLLVDQILPLVGIKYPFNQLAQILNLNTRCWTEFKPSMFFRKGKHGILTHEIKWYDLFYYFPLFGLASHSYCPNEISTCIINYKLVVVLGTCNVNAYFRWYLSLYQGIESFAFMASPSPSGMVGRVLAFLRSPPWGCCWTWEVILTWLGYPAIF